MVKDNKVGDVEPGVVAQMALQTPLPIEQDTSYPEPQTMHIYRGMLIRT